MPAFFRKLLHYAIRFVSAITLWYISFSVLIKMPIFFIVENGEVQINSPLPLLIPLLLAVGVYFLVKKPLNRSKHFYNPTVIKKRAQSYIQSIELLYHTALSADTVKGFLDAWTNAEFFIKQLSSLSNKLLPTQLQVLHMQETRLAEHQWKLCDAIDKSVAMTLSDLKAVYKHNRAPRATMFFDDIRTGTRFFSSETLNVVQQGLESVATAANVAIPSDLYAITRFQNSSVLISENLAEIQAIDHMEGLEFEHWCADLLTKRGYTNVQVTQGSGDQGVDILAQKDGIKYAIQCKCYSSDLGNSPVQEINTGKAIYHCHVGVVMTNRYFTAGAKEAAEATGVLLWDRDWINNALEMNKQSQEKPCEHIPRFTEIDGDNMLPQAVDVILETGHASVSTIQRKLKLGYARAARIMDEMEEYGLVGPYQGSKPRAILITKSQWASMKSGWITNRF